MVLDRLLFDTECYPNYWSCGVMLPSGEIRQYRIVGRNASGSHEHRQELYDLVTEYPVAGFNSKGYDEMMMRAFWEGYTCAQLHALSTSLIMDKKARYNFTCEVEWPQPDHIDAFLIMPMKPDGGEGGDSNSQKYIAGVIHSREMRDLPFDPELPLAPGQIAELESYNENDLAVLRDIYLHPVVQEAIALRRFMTAEYGIDLMNKSDAQMSEAIIWRECGSPKKQQIDPDEIHFNYDAPAYLRPIASEGLRTIIDKVESVEFTGDVSSIAVLKGLTHEIAGAAYTLGKGGLHSCEKDQVAAAADDELIIDIDVASYYPNMMRVAGAVPELLGVKFIDVLVGLIDKRLHAKHMQKECKKAGDKHGEDHWKNINLGLKICINGCFGKTGSRWSVLFAPKMMIQTTITGQLLLLLLLEMFDRAGIKVLSANTDGIVTHIKHAQYDTLCACVSEWEELTGLEMEQNAYAKLWSLDVNNYIAEYQLARPSDAAIPPHIFKVKPEVKRKGRFAPADLLLKKAPNMEIAYDAVCAYFTDGTLPEDTVFACTDIRKFVVLKNVTGKAYILPAADMKDPDAKAPEKEARLARLGWEKVKRGWWKRGDEEAMKTNDAYLSTFPPLKDLGGEFLGSKIRWYHALTDSPNMVVNMSRGAKVPGGDNVASAMLLPETFPDDVDHMVYINTAYEVLEKLGVMKCN